MPVVLVTIAGLPAHPLVAHGAVVLVPLAFAAHALTGWRRAWRAVYAAPAALLGVAGAVFAWASSASGEPLKDSLKDAAKAAGQKVRFGDHPDQGEAAYSWALSLAVLLIGFAALAFIERKRELPAWLPLAAWVVAGLVGVVAVAAMTVAGHSGAELVWKDVGTFAAGQ